MALPGEESAFKGKRSGHRLVRRTPPCLHLVPYATGGLQKVYNNIRERRQQEFPEFGSFTDEKGVFKPQKGMPLLADRYKYECLLGKGQSSILIKAKDTFHSNEYVSVKILHVHYHILGAQESDCIIRLNRADPYGVSATVKLKTTFSFDDHYCMVFELLNPKSLLDYFKNISPPSKKLQCVRKVTVRLLQAVGFFQHQNVIHADLKPENILLKDDDDFSSLKVVDLGNALHCVHEELSLYYDDFELQTLFYRAPEVLFGVPFSLEMDMWSVGCILAELYRGQPLFLGIDKKSVLSQMVEILGPLPQAVFQRGKFFSEFQHFTARSSNKDVPLSLMKKIGTQDYAFADFLKGLLHYNPAERMSVSDAARHPFLAPELALCYLLPLTQDKKTVYPAVMLNKQMYSHTPLIGTDVSNRHMTSYEMLRHGTHSSEGTSMENSTKKIAQIIPFLRHTPSPETVSENTVNNSGEQLEPSVEMSNTCKDKSGENISCSTSSDDHANQAGIVHNPNSSKDLCSSGNENKFMEMEKSDLGLPQKCTEQLEIKTLASSEIVNSQNAHRPSSTSKSPPSQTSKHSSSDSCSSSDVQSRPNVLKSGTGLKYNPQVPHETKDILKTDNCKNESPPSEKITTSLDPLCKPAVKLEEFSDSNGESSNDGVHLLRKDDQDDEIYAEQNSVSQCTDPKYDSQRSESTSCNNIGDLTHGHVKSLTELRKEIATEMNPDLNESQNVMPLTSMDENLSTENQDNDIYRQHLLKKAGIFCQTLLPKDNKTLHRALDICKRSGDNIKNHKHVSAVENPHNIPVSDRKLFESSGPYLSMAASSCTNITKLSATDCCNSRSELVPAIGSSELETSLEMENQNTNSDDASGYESGECKRKCPVGVESKRKNHKQYARMKGSRSRQADHRATTKKTRTKRASYKSTYSRSQKTISGEKSAERKSAKRKMVEMSEKMNKKSHLDASSTETSSNNEMDAVADDVLLLI